jgi:hypothetical protein
MNRDYLLISLGLGAMLSALTLGAVSQAQAQDTPNKADYIESMREYPTPPPVCDRLTDRIDRSLRTVAYQAALSSIQDSIPAAQLNSQNAANAMDLIALNYDLLKQHQCPLPTSPIDPLDYADAAMRCANAIKGGKYKDHPECNTTRWEKG